MQSTAIKVYVYNKDCEFVSPQHIFISVSHTGIINCYVRSNSTLKICYRTKITIKYIVTFKRGASPLFILCNRKEI